MRWGFSKYVCGNRQYIYIRMAIVCSPNHHTTTQDTNLLMLLLSSPPKVTPPLLEDPSSSLSNASYS